MFYEKQKKTNAFQKYVQVSKVSITKNAGKKYHKTPVSLKKSTVLQNTQIIRYI